MSDLDKGQIKSTREAVPERARRAFDAFDSDRDGQLDARELRHALRHYGIDASRGQAANVLESYDDENPNRRLDVREFANLVQDLELGLLRSGRPSTPGLGPRPPTPPVGLGLRPKSAGGGRRPPLTPDRLGARPLPDRPLGSRRSVRLGPGYDLDDEDEPLRYPGYEPDRPLGGSRRKLRLGPGFYDDEEEEEEDLLSSDGSESTILGLGGDTPAGSAYRNAKHRRHVEASNARLRYGCRRTS